jgi:hypothetical protein
MVPCSGHGRAAWLPLVLIRERAGPFSRWKALRSWALGQQLPYVLQDTDRRQARAYDDFFALPGHCGSTAPAPPGAATDAGKQGIAALTIGGENQNAYANQCAS